MQSLTVRQFHQQHRQLFYYIMGIQASKYSCIYIPGLMGDRSNVTTFLSI